jgi:hypothetical protein
VAALTTWPALTPPSLVAPKRTEPEGRTRTGSAHRISRDSNSDATKLSNTTPGLLHSASPVTSSNGEFEARRCVMVVNPRHHRYAGQRTSCLGNMRLISVFAFGRMVGGAVYCGLFPGLAHPLRMLPYAGWRARAAIVLQLRGQSLCGSRVAWGVRTGHALRCPAHRLVVGMPTT